MTCTVLINHNYKAPLFHITQTIGLSSRNGPDALHLSISKRKTITLPLSKFKVLHTSRLEAISAVASHKKTGQQERR